MNQAEEHLKRHGTLSSTLSELVEDFKVAKGDPSMSNEEISVADLLDWARMQAKQPDHPYNSVH